MAFFLLLNPLTRTNFVSDFRSGVVLTLRSLFLCLQLFCSGSLLSRANWKKAPEAQSRSPRLPQCQRLVLLGQQLQPHLSIPVIF